VLKIFKIFKIIIIAFIQQNNSIIMNLFNVNQFCSVYALNGYNEFYYEEKYKKYFSVIENL